LLCVGRQAIGRTTLEAADLSNNDFGSPAVVGAAQSHGALSGLLCPRFLSRARGLVQLAALKHGLCSNLRMKNLYLWGCRIKSEGGALARLTLLMGVFPRR
jgi:hypothetical protein